MKKFTIALVAVISAVLMCVGMAACSSDEVAGKTYVYDKVTASYDDTVADDDKLTDEDLAGFGENYNVELVFGEDGTVKIGNDGTSYFVQDGETVYIYSDKADADAGNKEEAMVLKVNGKNLEITEVEDGITLKIIFKKK